MLLDIYCHLASCRTEHMRVGATLSDWRAMAVTHTQGGHFTWKVLESPWKTFFPVFKAVEGKRIWSLKVLEFSLRGPWKSLNSNIVILFLWKNDATLENYTQYSEHAIIVIGSRALSFSDHYFHFSCLSVRMSVCQDVCQDVCPSCQNATCPSVLDRLSWYFNTMVPYLGKIILHGFLIRASWRQ